MINIWVPWIGEQDPAKRGPHNALAPDVPKGVSWTTSGVNTSPLTRRPFTDRTCVIVDEADIPAICTHLQAKGTDYQSYGDGAEKGRLHMEVMRAIGSKTGKARDDAADAIFSAVDTSGASRQRLQDIKDVLVQAAARGVSLEKAEAIRVRLNLPLAAQVE